LDSFTTVPEGYFINISSPVATLGASSYRGFVWAIQSFLQILPERITPSSVVSAQRCYIEDAPRFAWRSLLLDVSHQYFSPGAIKELVKVMSMHKLNTLQLHLTDEIWRLPSAGYPELTAAGHRNYSRAGIREIVAAARRYGVEVIPEVELMSHTEALLAEFPRLRCKSGKLPCLGSPRMMGFVRSVLEEVAELFESKYVSVGGPWPLPKAARNCSRCRRRMELDGLSSGRELLVWFIEHLRLRLQSVDRLLIVRDPPVNLSLHPSVVVASSLPVPGQRSVLFSPELDFSKAQLHNDRYRAGPGLVSLRRVYAFDPDRESSAFALNSTLGVQATLWTHLVADKAQLLYSFSPRVCALAEIGWTPRPSRAWSRFHSALSEAHYARLVDAGVHPASMDPYPLALWGLPMRPRTGRRSGGMRHPLFQCQVHTWFNSIGHTGTQWRSATSGSLTPRVGGSVWTFTPEPPGRIPPETSIVSGLVMLAVRCISGRRFAPPTALPQRARFTLISRSLNFSVSPAR
jgi:hexosaminidase